MQEWPRSPAPILARAPCGLLLAPTLPQNLLTNLGWEAGSGAWLDLCQVPGSMDLVHGPDTPWWPLSPRVSPLGGWFPSAPPLNFYVGGCSLGQSLCLGLVAFGASLAMHIRSLDSQAAPELLLLVLFC